MPARVRTAFLHDVVLVFTCGLGFKGQHLLLEFPCTVACWACDMLSYVCRPLQVEAPPQGALRPWVMRTAMTMCRLWKRRSGIGTLLTAQSACCCLPVIR